VPASASARFNAASIARVAPIFVTADDPAARTGERSLVQAAHIVPDVEPEGIAAVVNGLALCAIHHLAFDRNVLGMDPDGVVHVARRVLEETDGPMLRTSLQGFHGQRITVPRRPANRPDPRRLELRFERFERAAA
jgi:putative restriction endonuclease